MERRLDCWTSTCADRASRACSISKGKKSTSVQTGLYFTSGLCWTLQRILSILCSWIPVYCDESQRLAVMSIAFLLASRDDAIVWRGPKKNAMIKQFLKDVYWGELDYLVIDTPPGTSDEHITVVENLIPCQPDGAILVTTSQGVATADVRREVSFCRKTKLPILGIVENMSGYICPHCTHCTNVFSRGGGEELAAHAGVPFLGSIPIDPRLGAYTDQGKSFIEVFPESQACESIQTIAKNLTDRLDQSERSL
eukprot:m.13052 g.13052  ORF g.13052 m.13052 type:complete len:253 (+) comp24461_c0_seq1:119-877(+)